MSQYTNKIACGIAEIARLTFFDEFNNNAEIVSEIVMHVEVMRNMITVMQQTLDQFDENMRKMQENKNKLS